MKKLIWIVIILIVIWGVWFRGDKTPPVANGEPIKIGAIISQTGVAAAFGEMSKFGIEMAAKEINDTGGLEGRPVEVVYEDDRTDPKTAAGLYQKLTGIDKVDAIIGSNFDFVTQPLFSFAKDGDVVVVSPSNPRIPGAFDTNPNSFVMMTEFSDIVRVTEDYLQNITHNQLGILRFESSFGEEIQKTLNNIEIELGKKPIVIETYKEIGNNDFKTQILKLKQAGVDLVFLDMVAIDPITFMTQAKQLSYNPKVISHVGIQDALSIPDVDLKIFEGIAVVNWNIAPQSFIDKFEKIYGMKPDKSANRAYDAVYILAQAVVDAKAKTDIPKILETETFKTPNGSFKFSPDHAAETTAVELQVIKDGKFTKLK